MRDPFVSIIIPNFNNAQRLDQCLAALQQQSYQQHCMEVIVVDNGSTDDSVAVSKSHGVKTLIRTEYQSPYWCRNEGIRAARGEIIALLDSNCVPVAEWLRAGVTILQTSKAGVVIGPVRFTFSAKPLIAERIDYLYSVYTAEDVLTSTGLPATHLFTTKAMFDEIGYFIPHIRSLGDIEWTQRLNAGGHSFGFAPAAIVDYPAKPLSIAIKKMIRLGGGRKELWLAKGRSVYEVEWLWQIARHLLPPSPAYYREMVWKNKREGTQLSALAIFFGAWCSKLCYAWGMIFKQVAK